MVLERCRALRSPTDFISTLTEPYSSRTGLQPHFSASLRDGNSPLLAHFTPHRISDRFGKHKRTYSGAIRAIPAHPGRAKSASLRTAGSQAGVTRRRFTTIWAGTASSLLSFGRNARAAGRWRCLRQMRGLEASSGELHVRRWPRSCDPTLIRSFWYASKNAAC